MLGWTRPPRIPSPLRNSGTSVMVPYCGGPGRETHDQGRYHPPLPGATYGSFAAACHYTDGTFVAAPSRPASTAARFEGRSSHPIGSVDRGRSRRRGRPGTQLSREAALGARRGAAGGGGTHRVPGGHHHLSGG